MIILGQLFWTIGQGPQPGPSGRIGGDDVPQDHKRRRRLNEKRRKDIEAVFAALIASPEPEIVQRAVDIAKPANIKNVSANYGSFDLQALPFAKVGELLALWRDEQERVELMELLQILH